MPDSAPQLIEDFNKSLKGGRKRRGNASLKAWVTFVKKVAREEKIPYGAAMKRAKARKDKGEKWMMGGQDPVDADAEAEALKAEIAALSANVINLRAEAVKLRAENPFDEEKAAALEAEAIDADDDAKQSKLALASLKRYTPDVYDEDFYERGGGRRRKGKSHKKHGGSKKRRGGRRGTKKRRY